MVFKKNHMRTDQDDVWAYSFYSAPPFFFISPLFEKKKVSTSSHNETLRIVIHTQYIVNKIMAYVKQLFL